MLLSNPKSTLLLCVIGAMLIGCAPLATSTATLTPTDAAGSSIRVLQTPLFDNTSNCGGTFVTHELDHVTMTAETSNQLFESNGSGLGINDLNNDGLLDIVLANLDGPNSILWNEGRLNFRKELVNGQNAGHARAVTIIDYDGDGWLDIAFTHRRMVPPTLWRNLRGEGEETFAKIDPFEYGAYAMAWADLDDDTDLDLVTGAYDIEQEKLEGIKNLQRGNGVVLYENLDGIFQATQLTPVSQSLALLLIDLNNDRQLDILVGNDFFHPDMLWLQSDQDWQFAKLFEFTSQNTMSFDAGDLDNDGQLELFAADMKPYPNESMDAWQPLMANMVHDPFHNDPQIMANVLQDQDNDGQFREVAGIAGIDGTGWTWSAKFGDLDNDGLLDLYAVNGMVDPNVFGHMPGDELKEENQAFRNLGNGEFAPAPEWNLNIAEGGRGMSVADLDNDGDLDIVINNFMAPAQLLENRMCNGRSLEVDLKWDSSQNSRAIGARLTLQTSRGTYHREVRTASGYLSGDPSRVHFGFPEGSQPLRLQIRWPDGIESTVESPDSGTIVTIIRE